MKTIETLKYIQPFSKEKHGQGQVINYQFLEKY